MIRRDGCCFRGTGIVDVLLGHELSRITRIYIMKEQAIAASIRSYVAEHFARGRKFALSDTDPLLQSGIIDSMGVLDLVGFIENKFGMALSDEDLSPDNFYSIATLAAFIARRSGSPAGQAGIETTV